MWFHLRGSGTSGDGVWMVSFQDASTGKAFGCTLRFPRTDTLRQLVRRSVTGFSHELEAGIELGRGLITLTQEQYEAICG